MVVQMFLWELMGIPLVQVLGPELKALDRFLCITLRPVRVCLYLVMMVRHAVPFLHGILVVRYD